MATKRALGIDPDPRPDLLIEKGPDNAGVGRWVPEQKHMYLTKYVDGTRAAANKWSQRVFIDPFCGPGRIQVKGESQTRDGGALIAWRQALNSGVPYSQLLVGDLVSERALACEARLKAIAAPAEAFIGPAEQTVYEMLKRVPQRALCTVYLDPYNLADRKFNFINTIIAVFCIIKSLPIGVCLGAYTGPVGRGFSRSVAMTRFGRCQAQPRPAALANPLLPSLTNSTYQLTR